VPPSVLCRWVSCPCVVDFSSNRRLTVIVTQSVVLSLAVCLTACDMTGPVACTENIARSIIVEIGDSISEEPLAERAEGEVRDGGYIEALKPYGFRGSDGQMISRYAGDERPGRYDVEVRLAGYATWTKSNVNVSRGDCHVGTVTLQARMQRAP
jgi:hypothetical protein